ncbi:MAG: murein biosynthesis integral membrane protein MurJ [candidate division Zixibacteria bacterium]|nr:murein biosynthesis integral membrane protein MurJ [candidate division Zixibacteria bacterium]
MTVAAPNIQRTTIVLAHLVLLSKIIGFGREMIIAYRFGTGIEYDTYLIAISIPVALYTLIGYAFTNLFIPAYAQAAVAEDRKAAFQSLAARFTVSVGAAAIGMLAIIAVAPHLLRLIAPGLPDDRLAEAVMIMRVSSVIILFAVMEAYFRSALNAEKQFLLPAAAPIAANIVMIAMIALFAGRLSTRAVLWGLVLGYLVQVVINFIPFRRLGVDTVSLRIRLEKRMGSFFSAAVIILLIESAWQLYALVDRYYASSMPAGIVSALGYSYLLIMIPVSILAYALSTVLFPYLSEAFARNDPARTAHLLERGITVSLLLAVPATIICWVYCEPLVTVFFRRGEFDRQSVAYTSVLLKYSAPGLAGQFLLWIMSRAFYAAGRNLMLLWLAAAAVAVKIGATAAMVGPFGFAGLAISSSLSYSVGGILAVAVAAIYIARIDGRALLIYVIKLGIAGVAAWGAAWGLTRFIPVDRGEFGASAMVLILGTAVTLLVFCALGYLVNIADMRTLPNLLTNKGRNHDLAG